MEVKHFSRTTVIIKADEVKEVVRKHLEIDNGFKIIGDFHLNIEQIYDEYENDYVYILGNTEIEIENIHPNG